MVSGEKKYLDPEWFDKTRYDMQQVIEKKNEYIEQQQEFAQLQGKVVAEREDEIKKLEKVNDCLDQNVEILRKQLKWKDDTIKDLEKKLDQNQRDCKKIFNGPSGE